MNPFTGEQRGPTAPITADPASLFSLFFTNDLVSKIVTETNRYAALCRGDDIWATNAEELKAFFGFQILMGISKKPDRRDYWSLDERLNYPPVSSRIPRLRFEEISRYLHFVDNSTLPTRGEDGYTRLQKVDPIISAVRERCLAVFNPGAQNSIDEAMIPFEGCTCNYYFTDDLHVSFSYRPILYETVSAEKAN